MKKYRCSVIGAGFIGAVHVEAIRRLGFVDIVALCDVTGAEEKAKSLNIGQAYHNFRNMMDDVKPDVVHICTPNNSHYEIVKYAIEKGINFICEKPFTMSVAQAEELVRLADEKGVRGAVNFHNRLYPMPHEIRELVKNGELGEIFTVHGEYIQDWLLHETDYSWRLVGDQVGKTRAIADIGSHWIDLAEFVTGLKITKVCAKFKTVYPVRKKPIGKVETFASADADATYEEIKIDTEDCAVVLFEFENGAIGTCIVSQVFSGKKNTTTLSIAGSRKSAVWNSEALNDLYLGYREKANENLTKDASLVHAGTSKIISYPGGHAEGFPDALKQAFLQFYGSLDQDCEYEYATPADGLRNMLICEAIFNSAMSGEWREVNCKLKSG